MGSIKDFMICLKDIKTTIRVDGGKMDVKVTDFLIHSYVSNSVRNMAPLYEWLPESTRPKIKVLESTQRLEILDDNMQSDTEVWQSWFDVENAQSTKLPDDAKVVRQMQNIAYIATRSSS